VRVWIVNPFDNLPAEGFRPQRYWLMARAFAHAGDEVTLWTADFSHAFKRPRVFRTPPAGEGFALRLIPVPSYPRNICLRRVWSHRRFAARWRAAAARETPPDVVIVSLPPLAAGSATAAFCRRTGARLVVDVQDAWPETFEQVAPRWALAPLRAQARAIYRAADAVTGVAQRYLDLARAYGSAAPSHLAYLGMEMPPLPPAHAPGAPFRLVYAGNMGRSYDLATAIDAVKAASDVSLDLAGTGPEEAALRARAAGCDRIRFHGYLDAPALAAFLAEGDAGVLPFKPASCVGVPGKLMDYAAAGLPVISSLAGETADILEKFRAGVVYRAGDLVSFHEALASLRSSDTGCRDRAGLRDLFDAARLYGDYVSFVKEQTR